MKSINKLFKGKQKGQALVLALALLGLGSLMIAPMMAFMGTGLEAGVVMEDKLDELYDADAGVQDALWKINNPELAPGLPMGIAEPPLVYNIPILNAETVDDEIDIEITFINYDNNGTYRIRSWVGNSPVDYETKIDAIAATIWIDYYDFLEHVITSGDEIVLQPGSVVVPEDPDHDNGPRDYHPDELWPTVEELYSWYMRDINGVEPYQPDELHAEIDLADLPSLSSPYTENDRMLETTFRDYPGGDLEITSSINPKKDDPPIWLYLGDPEVEYDPDDPNTVNTIFVVGDLLIDAVGGDKNYTLDMNMQTIFVDGDVVVDQDVSFTGHGCIVASGDVFFQPKMVDDPDSFIFVMSIEGTIHFQPQGDFYGALAGNVEVQMQPNSSIQWNGPEPGLNFPIEGAGGGGLLWGIHTWEIN